MRVQTEEWQRFIPGVRMYKGKKTLFWNGEEIWEDWVDFDRPLIYDYEERKSWEVIIVLPGVEVIPTFVFNNCDNVEAVVMADTVQRIKKDAFIYCESLEFVKLSTNLEFIGEGAFYLCKALTSMFIPPSCREIDDEAFWGCKRLLILGMPQHVHLGDHVFKRTMLIQKSPIETDERGDYHYGDDATAIQWVKSINNEDTFALHRSCSSFNPLTEIIHGLVKRHGINAMKMKNAIGITPSQYLEANTFADISEKEIINRSVLNSVGELL